jgi:hypothetical protein
MSVRVMTLVWELDLPDSEKIVLLALADCANDEGHCWPGINALKRKCSKSDRTIQLAIKMLCAKGHLTRREVLGKGCNYTVHPIVRLADPRSNFTPEESSPPKGTTETPEAASGKPSVTIIPEAKASYQVAIDLWNELSVQSKIPAVRVLNNSRKQMLRAREKEHGLDAILEAIRNVHASPFCRGGQGARRKADIMFILQPKTLARAIEGYYGTSSAAKLTDPADIAKNKHLSADLYEKMGNAGEAQRLRSEAAELLRKMAPIVRAA